MAGFRILNAPTAGNNAASFIEQARPDAGDIDVLVAGQAGYGVVSGCVVVSGGGMGIVVGSSGDVALFAGTSVDMVAASATLTDADPTNDRIDVIVAQAEGTFTVLEGMPAIIPAWPSITDGDVVVGMVVIPAAATGLTISNIIDKRVILPVPSNGVTGSSAPAYITGVPAEGTGAQSIVLPTVSPGELMILAQSLYWNSGGSPGVTTPEGWTGGPSVVSNVSQGNYLYVYTKVATSEDSGATVTGLGASDRGTIVLGVYSAGSFVDTSAVFEGGGDSIPSTPVTTTEANELIVTIFGFADGNNLSTIAAPDSARLAITTEGSTGYCGIALSDEAQATAGMSTSQVATRSPTTGSVTAITLALALPIPAPVRPFNNAALVAGFAGYGVKTGCEVLIGGGVQLPTLRGLGTHAFPSDQEVDVTLPSATETGDFILVGVTALGTTSGFTWSTPTGWTQVTAGGDTGGTYANCSSLFSKVATGADASTVVTFNFGQNGGGIAACCLVFADCEGVDDVVPFHTTSGQTAVDSLPVASTVVNDLVVTIAGVTMYPESDTDIGYTGSGAVLDTNSHAASSLLAISVPQPAVGDSTAQAFTIATAGSWSLYTVALLGAAPVLGLSASVGSSGDEAYFAGVAEPITATTVSFAAADPTDDRIDLVVAAASGVVSVVEGIPAVTPLWPAIPDASVILASGYLVAQSAGPTVFDERVIILPPSSGGSSDTLEAPTYVDGISYGFVGSDPNDVIIPSTVEAGDWLVLGMSTYAVYGGTIPPTGWTAGPATTADGMNFLSFTKIATLEDAGATVVISDGTGHRFAIALAAYRGVTSATGVVTTGTGTVEAVPPVVTTTTLNNLIVNVFGVTGGGAAQLAPGATARLAASDAGGVGGAGYVCAAVSDAVQAAVGASTPVQADVTNGASSSWAAATFVLVGAEVAPVISPLPVVAASPPDATTTGFYYDTTLGKLGVSDGTYWHYYSETSTNAPMPGVRASGVYYDYTPTDNTLPFTVPAGAEAGDTMLLSASTQMASDPFPADIGGWTRVDATTVGTNISLHLWTKTVQAGEPGTTYDIVLSENMVSGGTASVLVLEGSWTVNTHINTSPGATPATSPPLPPVTTTVGNCMVIYYMSSWNEGGTDTMTDCTQLYGQVGAGWPGGDSNTVLALGYNTQPTAGTGTLPTVTGANGYWGAITVAMAAI